MTCDPIIREQLTAYVLGDLDATAAAAVRAHLDACRDCQAAVQEIESTLGLVRDALAGSVAETTGGLSPERRQRALAALAETPIKPQSARTDSPVPWLTSWHPKLAFAAGMVIVVGLLWFITPHAEKPRTSDVFEVSLDTPGSGPEDMNKYYDGLNAYQVSAPAPATPAAPAVAPARRAARESGALSADEIRLRLSMGARDKRQVEELGDLEEIESNLKFAAEAPPPMSMAQPEVAAPADVQQNLFETLALESDRGVAVSSKPEAMSAVEALDQKVSEDLGLITDLTDVTVVNGEKRSEPMVAAGDEFAPQPAAFDSVAMIKSPVKMTGTYGSRTPAGRGRALAEYGGGSGGESLEDAAAEAAPASSLLPQEQAPASAPVAATTPAPKPVVRKAGISHKQKKLAETEVDAPAHDAVTQSIARRTESWNFEKQAAPVEKEAQLERAQGWSESSGAAYYRSEVGKDDFSEIAKSSTTAAEGKARFRANLHSTSSDTLGRLMVSTDGDSDGSAKPRPPEERLMMASSVEGEAPAEPMTKNEHGLAWGEPSTAASLYFAYGINNTVESATTPLSTFAIDVDTASYTQARQFMNRGLLPPPEAVRTEEFINFFDYDYPAPDGPAFRIHAVLAPSRFGHGEHLLKLGIKGRRLGREEQRPAALTLLVDTSGSMETPDRLGLLQRSLHHLVERLGAKDVVSLVQYGDHARVVLDRVPATERDRILGAIDALQCTGSTNLEEGMGTAYSQAAAQFVAGGENRVLVLTDGMANLGADTAEPILAKVAAQRRQGIRCSIFGFGEGAYNDVMLESLADKGDGVYAFIDSEAEAKRLFVDDLAATLNTIASDVKIQVEFNPAVTTRYRQLGYENRQLTDQQFRDDTVDAGEVGSGQSVTALYEISLVAAPADAVVATVRVRYRDLQSGKVEEIALPVHARDARASFDAASTRFRLSAAVAEFAEQLRGSPYAASCTFDEVADVLRPVALDLNLDAHVQELLRLVEQAGGMSRAPDTVQP